MIIKIMCEWCNRAMKTVNSFEKVRDAQQKNETICPTCKKKVERVEAYFGSIRKTYDSKIDVLIREMKSEFREGLKKGDFDGGKNIQDLGSKDKAA